MGGEGCRVRRREEEGVITHMTRWGERKKKIKREDEEQGERMLETREVSKGNIQFVVYSLRINTHVYTDMNSDQQMLILDMKTHTHTQV